MAPLCISGSREYAIFQAFANNDKYADALKDMERFDSTCEGMRIFSSGVDKKSMRKSFMFFKKAEAVVSRGTGKPDYDDPVIVERLKTVFGTEISDFCVINDNTSAKGVMTKKNIIGSMIDRCTRVINTMDARDWQRISRERGIIRHEQAVVDKSGITDHGGFARDSVISRRSGDGDKPMSQILYERGLKEKEGRA